jgi:hippurate hydrolase
LLDLCEGIAHATGTKIECQFLTECPAVVNHPAESDFAAQVAAKVVSADQIVRDDMPATASDDFAHFLRESPGAYIFLGQGEGVSCHHPKFDFNDDLLPIGASFWAQLVEDRLALGVNPLRAGAAL